MRSAWFRTACGIAAITLGLIGCPSGDDDAGDGASCDEVGVHVERICREGIGSIMAAKFAYDCATFGYTPATKRCVLAATACDEDSLGQCDVRDRTWVCGPGNTECPPALECNMEAEECLQCGADSECDSGELCASGWCVRDTETNRAFADLLDEP